MCHFGVSPTTTVVFVEEIRVIEFTQIYVFHNMVNFKAGLLQIYRGVTNSMEIITKYMERASFWCKFRHA